MPDRTFAIVDPFAGASGDMFLGAISAVTSERDWLQELPTQLGLPEVRVREEQVDRCTVRCTRVSVVLPGERSEGPADMAQGHDPWQAAGHAHGPHRHVGELIDRIERSPLSARVRERAVAAFRLLGEAEGRVHGLAGQDVPLHEVGAWDALIDIVGTMRGLEVLGVEALYAHPVALGEGWVHAAHGHLPVPAPATAILAEGLEIRANGPVRGEATTPTGAALLRTLSEGAPPTRWRSIRSGWGAGTRNPDAYPNALRLIVAEDVPEASTVGVLSMDVDDLNPEYLEPLREALVAAGALDVQVWPTQMKKGRVGFRIEALVEPGVEGRVTEACFTHSTTAGVRWTRMERVTLARHEQRVTVAGEVIRVKVLAGPAGPRFKPEYDDVARVARATARSALDISAEATRAAESLPTPGEGNTHKESA